MKSSETYTLNGYESNGYSQLNPYDYKTGYSYDGNGNIRALYRYKSECDNVGAASTDGYPIDDQTYHYYAGTNKLKRVDDLVAANSDDGDIDDQNVSNNYIYDLNGNLTYDYDEAITINWNNFNKIEKIISSKTGRQYTLTFRYDALNNRIEKSYINDSSHVKTTTYYLRDAQGNILSTYEMLNDSILKWKEQHLYGSARVGVHYPNKILYLKGSGKIPLDISNDRTKIHFGKKNYEVTDHLGNVMAVVDDWKTGIDPDQDGDYDHYEPTILRLSDYYPFGMPMPGREYESGNKYRFGFGGQEKDDEISGNGNLYSAEFWEYNSRLGRRWNIDPIVKVWMSPYHAFSNKPILNIDPNGANDGEYITEKGNKIGNDGKVDNNVHIVTNKKDISVIKSNDKNGGSTPLENVASAIKLPPQKVREQIGSVADLDKQDNTREYGGIFGKDENGNIKVVFAKPGGKMSLENSVEPNINPFDAKDPNELMMLKNVEGTFHSHPSLVVSMDVFGNGSSLGGSKQVRSVIQNPSSDDIRNAATRQAEGLVSGNSYVVGTGNITVYIYNGSGVQATLPLDKFINIGK